MAARMKRYPSDLTVLEWAAMERLLATPAQRGRRRTVELRKVINALRPLKANEPAAAHRSPPIAWWGPIVLINASKSRRYWADAHSSERFRV